MKLLIDINNVIYASFFVNIAINKTEFTPGFVYHLFLNKLLMLKNKFNCKNKDIVLAFDHKIMWRRKYFPQYKVKRQEYKEKTGIDFKQLFEIIEKLYVFLYNNCTFITLREKWLESDDWIGILSKYYNDEMVIVSTDKDFYQCHSNKIKQYDHIKGKYISINNPTLELLIKILNGDKGDGIPNFLSDDDTFVNNDKRQKSLGENKIISLIRDKKLKEFIIQNNCQKNFKRNNMLINFDKIPEKIKKFVINKIETYEEKYDMMGIMGFLHREKLDVILGKKEMLID